MNINQKFCSMNEQFDHMGEQALAYAKQCLFQYRKAAKFRSEGRRHFCHDKVFRQAFVLGILSCREFIRNNQPM